MNMSNWIQSYTNECTFKRAVLHLPQSYKAHSEGEKVKLGWWWWWSHKKLWTYKSYKRQCCVAWAKCNAATIMFCYETINITGLEHHHTLNTQNCFWNHFNNILVYHWHLLPVNTVKLSVSVSKGSDQLKTTEYCGKSLKNNVQYSHSFVLCNLKNEMLVPSQWSIFSVCKPFLLLTPPVF
jgi:hypothetical protein